MYFNCLKHVLGELVALNSNTKVIINNMTESVYYSHKGIVKIHKEVVI